MRREIEANLDAISVTPRIHREDLLCYVHRPTCQLLKFDAANDQNDHTGSTCLEGLKALRNRLLLPRSTQQPTVHDKSNGIDDVILEMGKNFPSLEDPVLAFCRKAEAMKENLGSWAAEYFVVQTLQMLENGNYGSQRLLEYRDASRQSLLTLFEPLRVEAARQAQSDPGDDSTTSKVKCLISFLLEDREDEPMGIVFVEQRATTSVLAALLRQHPATKEKFSSVSFVGTSSAPSRKWGLTELVDLKAQKETLGKFRAGEHNILVATNALEEGIDVQSCNIVACFDPPANVKSFIQRRGRARHMRSRLAILLSGNGDHEIIDRWQSFEEELSRICQSDRERVNLVRSEEDQNEEMGYELVATSTRYVRLVLLCCRD